MEMIRRIISKIDSYLGEPDSERRLLALRVDDLIRGSASEWALIIHNYARDQSSIATVEQHLSELPGDKLADFTAIANVLGLRVFEVADLGREIQSRGICALSLVPHLPQSIIKDVSSHWGSYAELRTTTVEDLQSIEGVGPYRTKLIHENPEHQAQVAANGLAGW